MKVRLTMPTWSSWASASGFGSRHLNRLFRKHLGASPTQVARTARVQRAKRLIDGTELAMTEIALSSGFRSLRRFNAAFVEVYQRSPTEVRRFARANGRGPRTTDGRFPLQLRTRHLPPGV